ncbi:MAG: MarR family transcriptional regulator [Lachnospiraceae bacterium]|nr:MarR family transcriptional regulator [Lachnospiraceae bacterium]
MKNRFETFALSILELNRCLQKIKDMEMKAFGLRANHVMCLYYLGIYEEGLTAAQLTEYCREDKAAISRSLSQLSEQGLVAATPPSNKRSYRTLHFLTEQGKETVAQIKLRMEEAVLSGGKGLSEEQRDTFYHAMEIILKNLKQYFEEKEKLL